MLKIWNLKNEQKEELPVIIPLLIYHGKNEWNIGLKLSDIIEDIPEEAEEYLPDFKYILFDLSEYSREEIKGAGQMRVFVDVLSAVFQDDFTGKLYDAFKVLNKLEEQDKGLDYFRTIIKYLLEAEVVDATYRDVEKIVTKVSKEKGEEVMSIAEELREEGKKEREIEMVKKMLDSGLDLDKISEISGLSKEKIKELQKSN